MQPAQITAGQSPVADSIGKDEVGGSNPASSSKKHRKLRFSVLFVAKMLKTVRIKMWVNYLTHTLGAVCALADVALAVGAFLSHIESTPFLVATTHTTTPRRKLLLFRALEFNSTLLFTGGSSNT